MGVMVMGLVLGFSSAGSAELLGAEGLEAKKEEGVGKKKPKAVVFIYADDVGYGDFGCYGAKAIPTPHVDKLAAEGLRFTDAYSTSATCTPSRYALMTGEYPWRRKGTGVLPGDAAMIVPPAEKFATLASVMRDSGYKTCAIGKWHLGLGRGKIDWNEPLVHGLEKVGFEESFIMAATADRVPCVYLRNGKVEGLEGQDPIQVSYQKNFEGEPTGKKNPDLLRYKPSHGHDQTIVDGISRIGFMKGGQKARWKDQDMADTLTEEAIGFIKRNKERPFFLYFATNDIHVPRDPHQRFIGKSQCGIRGDVTVQFDDCVGRLMKTLKECGLEEDTLVILTSDNGPVVDDGYQDGAVEALGAHRPTGVYRGGKYSLLEGGTRVPFLVSWKGQIPPAVSSQLMSQLDVAKNLAALVGYQTKEQDFPDSEETLEAWWSPEKGGRAEYVVQGTGNQVALREGDFKYYPRGATQRDGWNGLGATLTKVGEEGALYDLKKDPKEQKNLVSQYPQKAQKMAARLEEIEKKTPR